MKFAPSQCPDIVLCTAGIHHLPRADQPAFIQKVAAELLRGGTFIVGEEVISPYTDENTRLKSVVELGGAILKEVMNSHAPPIMLTEVLEVMKNDIEEREFKLDLGTLESLIQPVFTLKHKEFVWPTKFKTYGDVIFVCERN